MVSGGSGLIAAGGGSLALNAANTYSGGTTVIDQTKLIIGSDAALGAAGSPLVIESGELVTTADITSSRPVTVDRGGSINSNGNALDLTSGIAIDNGSGLVSLYTGGIIIVGEWSYSDHPGLVIDGMLEGTGTVSQPTTFDGALSPGDSPGTITFTAPLTLTSGALTLLDVDGTGQGNGAGNYDRVVVSGAGNTFTAAGVVRVKLRGITGSANNTYTPPVGQLFDVIHADGGVLGSYSGLTEPTSGLNAGTQFDALYSANDINLVVTPVAYNNLTPIGVRETANRLSLGASIDSYRSAPGIRMTGNQNIDLTALYSLPAGSIGAALDQIDGSVQADVMNAAISVDRMMSAAIDDHRAGANPITGAATQQDYGVIWGSAVGGWNVTGNDGNAPGYHGDDGGAVLGFDLSQDPAQKYGVAIAYAKANVSTGDSANASVQNERIVAYGRLLSGDWGFDGQVSAALNQFNSNRTVQLGSLVRVATGSVGGYGLSADAVAHYDGWNVVSPFIELRNDYENRSAFTEHGVGGFSLSVHDTSLDTPRSVLGIDLHAGEPSLHMDLKLGWAHDFGQVAGEFTADLTGSPLVPFKAVSSQIAHDAGLAHLVVSSQVSDETDIYI